MQPFIQPTNGRTSFTACLIAVSGKRKYAITVSLYKPLGSAQSLFDQGNDL